MIYSSLFMPSYFMHFLFDGQMTNMYEDYFEEDDIGKWIENPHVIIE